ncbi:TIGR03936 family radical SAM-associated protein [Stieleria varia]|uniref:DUF2344 domain-containing protein n=1 Tax=Stieleria varia TaxID=2528005 RepID=A0A5C5ZZI3_9BACT|nr:TIGR03936 family radical SAM-associated protein [Stieleria varia]TWT92441.1 hypothetical protein Pla52n_63150 [Stieleria varia]
MKSPELEITNNDDAQESPELLRVRYRIRFSKTDLLRWTSHRDLARLWERLLRRAQLNLSMTEGFHPKPRVGFPSALALGTESLDEVVEIDLAEELAPQVLLDRLADDHQPGLTIKSVQRIPVEAGKAKLQRSDFQVALPDGVSPDELRSNIEQFLGQETVTIMRKDKPLTVSVKKQINNVMIENGMLMFSLIAADAASLRPSDVLDLLSASDWIERGTKITRSAVILAKECEPNSDAPLAVATSLPASDPPTAN